MVGLDRNAKLIKFSHTEDFETQEFCPEIVFTTQICVWNIETNK